MDELLEDRPDGRLSGLVVGRVQSGKTRNYVGLALKAAEAGWNVIIFFSAAYPKDKTRFNGLFTDQVLAENGIAKTCGRPITWQYQG